MRGLKNIRLSSYNYRSDGWYFITIVTTKRQKFFLDKNIAHKCESSFRQGIGSIPGARIDILVVMPDHLHAIIVLEGASILLGEVIRRLKARTTREFGYRLWQPNYYEHIIRNERSLYVIRKYIILNPEKEFIFNKTKPINGRATYMPE